MKVLLINDIIAPYGGAEQYTIELAYLLSRHGIEVDILTARSHVDLRSIPPKTRVLIYDYNSILSAWRLGITLPRILIEKLAEHFMKYQVIHFNNTILNAYISHLRKYLQRKYPIFVRTVHDYREVCPILWRIKKNAICPHLKPGLYCVSCRTHLMYQTLVESPPLTLPLKSLVKNTRNTWRCIQLLSNAEHYDIIIAPSMYLAKLLKWNLRNPRIIHLYNFAPKDIVKISSCLQRPQGIGERKQVLLYIGRLSIEKGAHLLPLVAKALKKEYGNVMVLIAGKGPLRGYIERCMKKFKLTNTKLLGYISGEEKVKLLSIAYAIPLPSICCENHPIVITEAFSLGKPIICLLYTSPSPRDLSTSRMPSSA